MRWSVTLLLLLAACGRGANSSDEPQKQLHVPPITARVDDRCDPSRSRQCIGNDVVACEPDGKLGRRLQACHAGCEHDKCVATCADDGVELIYVVDVANELLSFDPRKLPQDPFHKIGTLQCEKPSIAAASMAIDRHGVAWVLYEDGQMFKVSIDDASCQPSPYVPSTTEFHRFGMGFVTDKPGSTSEKLFIASHGSSSTLGIIDTEHDLTPRRVGPLTAAVDSNPELTGTSEAGLFGFYPVDEGPSFVQEIDRATGAPKGRRWLLGKSSLGAVTAFAFAQWAGVFYTFVTTSDDSFRENSTVRAIDRATGSYRVVLDHLP